MHIPFILQKFSEERNQLNLQFNHLDITLISWVATTVSAYKVQRGQALHAHYHVIEAIVAL